MLGAGVGDTLLEIPLTNRSVSVSLASVGSVAAQWRRLGMSCVMLSVVFRLLEMIASG